MPEWKYEVEAGGYLRLDSPPYQMTLQFDPHTLLADEPLNAGGGDTGPDPFEFLAASLVACTSITVRMYADRKQWPLEQIDVKVELKSDLTQTQMYRHIRFHGPLDEEQRQRLLQIANLCPVHKALHNPIQVHTDLLP